MSGSVALKEADAPRKPINSELQRSVEPFLKSCLGLTVPALLDGLAMLQTYAKKLAPSMAALAQIDWAAAKRRLEELPTKSKEAMVLASSKGWFFGWHESLGELVALVEKLAVIEQSHMDEFMGQYYRNNLELLTPGINTPKGVSMAANVCLEAARAKISHPNFDHSVYSAVIEVNIGSPAYHPGAQIAGKSAERYDIAVEGSSFYRSSGPDLAAVKFTCLLSPTLELKAIQPK